VFPYLEPGSQVHAASVFLCKDERQEDVAGVSIKEKGLEGVGATTIYNETKKRECMGMQP
jgi:hypothetical protein